MSSNPDAIPNAPDVAPNGVIPEFWPPADGFEPVPTRRIPWLLAPLVAIPAMFAPRRFGPHLAQAEWKAAFLVHFLSAIIVLGLYLACIARYESRPQFPSLESAFSVSPSLEFREAFACVALLVGNACESWTNVLISLAVIAGVEACIWLVALLLVPLYAAGEGAKRAYLRCVKLLFWSTACQLPIFWLFLHFGYPILHFVYDQDFWIPTIIAFLEFGWLSVLYRFGGRYGGPADGPRWKPRSPRCEICGYSLVGLYITGNCPECNSPVADSLPNNRKPTAFARARGVFVRARAFFTTLLAVYRPTTFARRTPLWHDHHAARNFAMIVCALFGAMIAVSALGILIVNEAFDQSFEFAPASMTYSNIEMAFRFAKPYAVVLLVGLGAALVAAMLILFLCLIFSRFGFRDCANRIVPLFYGSAWMLLIAFTATLGGWAAYGIVAIWRPERTYVISMNIMIDYESIIRTAGFLPSVVTLALALRALRLLLKSTRYANA